jgi:hypothetical protein
MHAKVNSRALAALLLPVLAAWAAARHLRSDAAPGAAAALLSASGAVLPKPGDCLSACMHLVTVWFPACSCTSWHLDCTGSIDQTASEPPALADCCAAPAANRRPTPDPHAGDLMAIADLHGDLEKAGEALR